MVLKVLAEGDPVLKCFFLKRVAFRVQDIQAQGFLGLTGWLFQIS